MILTVLFTMLIVVAIGVHIVQIRKDVIKRTVDIVLIIVLQVMKRPSIGVPRMNRHLAKLR